jgi:hypothetical protein
MCQRIEFKNQKGIWDGRLQPLSHAESFDALSLSANEGCHMCSLFKSGLEQCRPLEMCDDQEMEEAPRQGRIIVSYVPRHVTGSEGERLEI